LSYARWYGSALSLANGDVLVLSGTIAGTSSRNPLPQVWSADQEHYSDLTTASLVMNGYPKIYLVPNGKVFRIGQEHQTYFLDTTGPGQWAKGPDRKGGVRASGPSAMYDDGKLLIVGGAPANSSAPVKTAEIIDLNVLTPAWKYTSPMQYAR